MEFNLRCGSTKDLLYHYFYKNLWLSIRLWINEKDQDLNNWNTLIKKAIQAKAKVRIQASAGKNFDQHCHRSNRLVYTFATKAQALKDLQLEKFKAQSPKSLKA